MDAPKTFTTRTKARRSTTINSEFYASARWQELSKWIRRRDPLCKVCSERPSRQADHILPINDGGDRYDPTNLQGICLVCHRLKSHVESVAL